MDMKTLITLIIITTTLNAFSQSVTTIEERPKECCQHYDEEYGETWTILYFATDKLDAQRMSDRYEMFDIANDFFESSGDYYIELIDPTDTLEFLKEYNFNLFNENHKKQLIFIDFLVTDDNQAITDGKGNKIMIK